MSSVVKRATAPRTAPFPVRAHGLIETTFSVAERIGRGLIGAAWCLAALLLIGLAVGMTALADIHRDDVLLPDGAMLVTAVAAQAWGARARWHTRIARVIAVAVPATLVLFGLIALICDLVKAGLSPALLVGDILLLALACVPAVYGLRILFEAWAGTRKAIDSPRHGAARFADRKDIQRYGLTNGDGGIVLGRHVSNGKPGPWVYFNKGSHLITAGPTDAGKTWRQLMMNLARWSSSAIVLDPKGRAAEATAEWRKRFGPVYIVDPFNTAGLGSCGFNPLLRHGRVMDWKHPHFVDDVMNMAEALVPVSNEGKENPHWPQSGQEVIAACIMHEIVKHGEKACLGRVREMIAELENMQLDKSGVLAGGVLYEMINAQTGPRAIRTKAIRFAREREEVGAQISAALTPTRWLDSDILKGDLSKASFDFGSLVHQPATVFVIIPAGRIEQHAGWTRLLVVTALRQILEQRGGRHRVLFACDEFPAFGKLPQVREAFTVGREFGLLMWVFVQTLAQLQDLYGEAGLMTFLSQCGAMTAFAPGAGDTFTASHLAEMLGHETVRTPADHGKPVKFPRTRVLQPGAREGFTLAGQPLLWANDIARLEEGHVLAWCRPCPDPMILESPLVFDTPWGGHIKGRRG